MTHPTHDITTVVIADDHAVVRRGLRSLLATVPDIEVVGEAATGTELETLVQQTTPDVALVDLHMPDGNGLDATRRIGATHPTVAVVILTMSEDPDSIDAALRSGAKGYLLKGADQTDVIEAIRAASRGHVILGPGAAERLVERLANPHPSGLEFPELTTREREVLRLLADGHDNTEIGRALHLSPKTVANHLSNILTRLHVETRAEAIVAARRAGMGTN